ncbi:MAG: helix-turn-helix domain-containing protein [Victivallaceae bacterium]
MNAKVFERDTFIDPNIGANVSYHSISWNESQTPVLIPSGGNINYHSLPVTGTMPHTHDFAEIILMLSGRLTHNVNGEKQILSSGNIVFIRPTDEHDFSPLNNEKCEVIFLDFQLELFLTLSKYLEDDVFLQQFTAPVLPPTFILESAETTDLCNRLLSVNSSRMSRLIKKVKLKIIIAELFTRFFIDDINLLRENQVPDWLEELCAKMRKPENFIPGLKKLHKLACCTPEHLCKSFRKYLKKSPTEFINELRINYAARLLADTSDEIGSIAYDLSFQSLSRFYHLFHKYYGVSPAKYRKRLKAGKHIF